MNTERHQNYRHVILDVAKALTRNTQGIMFEELDIQTADGLTFLWECYFESPRSNAYTEHTSDVNFLQETFVNPVHLSFWRLPLVTRVEDPVFFKEYMRAARRVLNTYVVGVLPQVRRDVITLLKAYEMAFTNIRRTRSD
jgi:hypothetical protein